MRIAVTGRPGTGKTTLCIKVYEALKSRMKISGFITVEEREKGVRVGFKLIDLVSNLSAQLARVGGGKIMVGKYEVLVENFDIFLDKLDLDGELLILDEVGPMELKSKKFVSIVQDLIERENLLFTVHYRFNHPLIERIRRDFKVYVIDERNRNTVLNEIVRIYVRD
ncbi:MAG: nucleoside-triphosphatase [Archaeoglobaceae archaeon]|nr:nucleoside triphosphatase [Archaeoglobaceae archaeon]MDW7989428.1 nucleoside-triphosphatase [Archaeoglobaceae archaeon]